MPGVRSGIEVLDLSWGIAAPGRFRGPPLVVGGQTQEILVELGFADEEISRLCDEGVTMDAGTKSNSDL